MTNYIFPSIGHIDDIRAAIAGRDEFGIFDRGDHLVADYKLNFDDTFPDPATAPDADTARLWALRRECRGLIFDKVSGNLVSRGFHKFFNLGERPETLIERLDIARGHVVLEKLDGSMVRPFRTTGRGLVWGTMMGETDVASQAAAFVAANSAAHGALAEAMLEIGVTPIFEWCSRQQQIVVDYAQDRLPLLALRDMRSGVYRTFREVRETAAGFGIEAVAAIEHLGGDINEMIAATRELGGAEGFVLRFDDGHMLKLKSPWYLRIHSFRSEIAFEKNVVALVLAKQVDDVLPFLPGWERDKILEFADQMNRNMTAVALVLRERVAEARSTGLSKKDFALASANDVLRPLLFKVWDGADGLDVVRDAVLKNTGSQPKLDTVRHLIGARWAEGGLEDA